MAKNPAKEQAPLDSEALQKKIEQQEKMLEALQAKVLAGEDAALERVCNATGVDIQSVRAKEASAPKPEDEVRMFVQTPVRINMVVYHGHIQCKISTARCIQQAIGDRRTRLINELTHNKWQLQELMSGGYAPKLVSRETIAEGAV